MEEQTLSTDCLSGNPRINRLLTLVLKELRGFTEAQAQQLSEMSEIGKALSAQRDPAVVLEMILSQARRITAADGGTLYLLSPDRKELVFHVVHTDSLNSYMGGTSGKPVTIPNVPLFNPDNTQNTNNVSAYVANKGKIVNIPDVYEAEGFNFEGTKKFDKALNYRSMSMLVVPMRDHEEEIIGVLQLINAQDKTCDKTIPFGPDIVDMVASLASQAAVVITQQRLIEDLKKLFESFIRAIATAIDEKSKYTGGHIERVAELTMTIAERINEMKEGPFAEVTFTEDELDEIRIAAWMHDTGKITTPEYVVDKSTKLETVFDRIELLKTRWLVIRLQRMLLAEQEKLELLKNDAYPEKIQAIENALKDDLSKLDEDIQFIEKTNIGGEFLKDDAIQRLGEIAQRHFQGNGEKIPCLTTNELENLAIRKGTLTNNEREIINNHATMTIRILNQLPWPRKLSRVPEIAGGHHEKLDGSGYPNGLKWDELSLQARILAVADVFEALSARDRPYKEPMSLSKAIQILGFMVKDNHLDKDVVDLFIKTGIHLEYARKYLSEKQIDIEAKT